MASAAEWAGGFLIVAGVVWEAVVFLGPPLFHKASVAIVNEGRSRPEAGRG